MEKIRTLFLLQLLLLLIMGATNLDAQTPLSLNRDSDRTIITLGTGNSILRHPFGMYFGFERDAALYPSSEIQAFGTIQSLAWYVGSTATASASVTIRMKTTSSSSLSQSTWSSMISGSTTVYTNSSLSFTSTGWKTLTLPTPYSYSSNNLLVLIETNYGGSGSTTYPRFTLTSVAGTHQYWNNDGSAPTGNGSLDGNRPNLRINITIPTVTPHVDFIKINGTPVTSGGSCNIALSDLNQTFSIELRGTNTGNTASVGGSALNLSFEQYTANADRNLIGLDSGSSSSDMTYASYYGSEALGGDGYADYVMFEGNDGSWNANEQNYYIVNVKAKNYGSFIIHYKMALINGTAWLKDPSSGPLDPIGENSYVVTVNVSQVTLPDLTIDQVTANPSSLLSGDIFIYSYRYRNTGNGNSGEAYTKFYLSDDQTFGNDTYLDQQLESAISATTNRNRLATLTMPVNTPSGNKYLYAYVDGGEIINESNENNNVAGPTLIEVLPTGSVAVTVKNIDDTSVPLPGPNGRVVLYDNNNNYLEDELTNASGVATFTNLGHGLYNIKVYHTPSPPTLFGEEYWGSMSINHSSSTTQVVFHRNMPYGATTSVFNNLTGENVTFESVPSGTQLRFEVHVDNPNPSSLTVKARLALDFELQSPWAFDQIAPETTINGNSNGTFIFYYVPIISGNLYSNVGVETYVSNWLVTDGRYWDSIGTPIITVTSSAPPIASASDISQQPEFIYPDTPVSYEVRTKYYDPDGRADIRLCSLSLMHPTADMLTMMMDFSGAGLSVSQGSEFLDLIAADCIPIVDNGIEGYEFAWRFVIYNESWASASSGIKFAVKATDYSGGQSNNSEWSIDNSNSSFKQYGITFISHGWSPPGWTFTQIFGWMNTMACAIKTRLGEHAVIGTYDNLSGSYLDSQGNVISDPGENELILLFNWGSGCSTNGPGYSEAAADAAYASMMMFKITNNMNYLHLIGHSRGSVVVSEMAERFIVNSTYVEQVTYIDPHDWGAFGELYVCSDGDVNEGLIIPPLPESPVQAFSNCGAVGWSQIGLIDTYFQTDPINLVYGTSTFNPLKGRPVSGAYNFHLTNTTHTSIQDEYTNTINNDSFSYGFALSRIGNTSNTAPDSEAYDGLSTLAPFDYTLSDSGIYDGQISITTPGWIYHGGEVYGTFVDHIVLRNAGINNEGHHATHNRFYIPEQGVDRILFKYRVSDCAPGTDDNLQVFLNNTPIYGNSWLVNQAMANWSDYTYLEIDPALKGTVCTLTFALVDPTRNKDRIITSEVWIDDIRFDNSQSVSTPANVQISKTGSILTLQWDPVPGAIGYRLESSNDPSVDFNLVVNATSTEWSTNSTEARKFFRVIAIK